jgi:hypothetical protein
LSFPTDGKKTFFVTLRRRGNRKISRRALEMADTDIVDRDGLATATPSYSGLGTWCDRKISFRCAADSSIAIQVSSVAAPQRPS